MRLRTASAVMAGLMVSSPSMAIAAAASGGARRFGQRRALEIGPGERGHEGVAGTGGVDAFARGCRAASAFPSGRRRTRRLRTEGDEHAVQAGVEQRLRSRKAQAGFVRDLYAGEQLGLDAVGLKRVELAEHRLRASPPWRWRPGSANRGGGAVLCQGTAMALGGDVRIQHDQPAALLSSGQLRLARNGGGHVLVDLHIADGQRHIARCSSVSKEVGGGACRRAPAATWLMSMPSSPQDGGNASGRCMSSPKAVSSRTSMPSRAHVVGNISSHAAEAHAHACRGWSPARRAAHRAGRRCPCSRRRPRRHRCRSGRT